MAGKDNGMKGARMKETNAGGRSFRFSMAMSPFPSVFAPLVFAGKLDEGMRALAKADFQGVEISLRSADDLEPDWLKKTLDELHLSISAFATGRMCLEESYCLCDPRQDHRDKSQERLMEIIRMAASFHAPVIIGGVRGKLNGDPLQKDLQRSMAIGILQGCANLASELGTHLLLEPINRYETNIMNSAQDALDLAEEIDRPGVKILLDTFHMNIEEVDIAETIRRVGKNLGYMHFADSNRLAPGQGHINFLEIMQTLAEIHYSGFICAEILPLPDDTTALNLTGQYLHHLVNEPASQKNIERSQHV